MENLIILWRVSITHYDFTKTVTSKVSYGYYRQRPENTIVKNTGNLKGWTEIKFFENKEDAQKCVWEAEEQAG